MDIIVWTAFDRNPITLRAMDAKAAWIFEDQVRSAEGDYAHLRAFDGYHMIRREHILRVHIVRGSARNEGGGDNGTV